MADDPIQADDGGSTRIKLHLRSGNFGEMDGLLNSKTLNALGKPYDGLVCGRSKVNQRVAPYGNVRVTYLDSLGKPFSFTLAFVELEIMSGDQRIHMEVLAAPPSDVGDVHITTYSVGCPQIVDVKQHKKRRRYVIANAPPIDQIFVTAVPSGASVMVYQSPDATVPRALFPVTAGAVDPVLYTSVVIT